MKIKHIYIVLSLFVISFLTVAAISTVSPAITKTNKDIIKFSHKKHSNLDCDACHKSTAESVSLKESLLPKKEACAECHDVDNDKDCEMCHYKDTFEAMVKTEAGVHFNHKFHMADQKQKDCSSCHKGIYDVAYSFETPLPQMNSCYACHNNKTSASEYCESCHISTVNLLPANHKTASFKKSHKVLAKSSKSDCAMCHDNSFCEACHISTTTITQTNSKTDFYAPYSTYNLIDGAKQQVINRVHELNYRFTHGIDAKGKVSGCKTCHNDATFCSECHDSKGGDFAIAGIVPANHKKPNFVTIGVGTGGGEHSIQAKRDIEKCSSCHDVQGGDANCVMCHVDNDGVKGTNPKTHARNYMRNTEGDWHNDKGSICFNCHVDANARPGGIAGVGFCGYCHSHK